MVTPAVVVAADGSIFWGEEEAFDGSVVIAVSVAVLCVFVALLVSLVTRRRI
jgi:hypothetical protein